MDKFFSNFLKAIRSGDRHHAHLVIEEALMEGIKPVQVGINVVAAAQAYVGELWHRGEMSVAEEHRATAISREELIHLRSQIRVREKVGKRVMVAVLQGEEHSLGAQLLSCAFEAEGWEVVLNVDPLPNDYLRELISLEKVDLLAISLTNSALLSSFNELLQVLSTHHPQLPVIVGGLASREMKLENCLVAHDIATGIKLAHEAVGLTAPDQSLEIVLKKIGAKILHLRKAKRLSQLDIGHIANLERSYISAVESGKQNLTVGALLRIATALEVSPRELFN